MEDDYFEKLSDLKFNDYIRENFNVVDHLDFLVYCCENNRLSALKLLIRLGVDIYMKDKYDHNNTILHTCNNPEAMKILLRKGYNGVTNKFGSTPLHVCKKVEIAKLLLEKGAYVDAVDHNGYTPLHYGQNLAMTKFLLENKADVNAKNKNGYTPLHYSENLEITKFLLDSKADVDAKDEDGHTPLFSCYTVEKAKLLVEYGANVNEFNNYGQTPLFSYSWSPKVAKFLVDNGAWTDVVDKFGTSLHDLSLRCPEFDELIQK